MSACVGSLKNLEDLDHETSMSMHFEKMHLVFVYSYTR